MKFKDHFSRHASIYQKFRPNYPDELFSYLAGLCEKKELAWDCGTGNGQAAQGLSAHFHKVIATDPSQSQIEQARAHPQITYRLASAEESDLLDQSIDLLCIAQALHWFDFERFYPEAERILKKGGLIAAWSYGLPGISEELDSLIQNFHDEILKGFWKEENEFVNRSYTTIPFPFPEIPSPNFSMEKEGNFEDLLGLLESFSAVQRYKEVRGRNPLLKIRTELLHAWGASEKKRSFRWQIPLLIGINL
ncbi:MAG: class I SAM-dependent methyltransferase [Bacteroidia bacterium]|nr:class I SAM-dependent methyltransferase [Bacteroidia bacterium]